MLATERLEPRCLERITPRRDEPARCSATILSRLPDFWQSVLFPGTVVPAGAAPRFALPLLLLFASALLFPFLGFHLFEPDEGRYAQIPLEMMTTGNWLVPTLQGEPYLDKPPLFYWLVMLAYRLFGPADWVARLVPAIAILATVLATFLLARKPLGERAAFWGALLLSVTPGLVSMGRILVLDGLLTLWVTVALLAGLHATAGPRLARGWWGVVCMALGLGMLTKGPIALVLVLVPLLLHRWLTGRATPISRRAWLALAGTVLVTNAPWYLAITWAHPEFASYFLWKHNVQRFLQPFDHERPVWFFGPVLLAGIAPLVWVLPGFVRYLLRDRPDAAADRTPQVGFCLLAAGFCVFFFSLSGSKLPTYILPAFPPLVLALGAYVVRSGWSESRWLRGGLVVWAAVLLVGHGWVLPAVAWERSPMNHATEARAYLDDTSLPIFCLPRNVDSVAFYLGRSDFRVYRSKEMPAMFQAMDAYPRSVLLFAHRSSRIVLAHNLPPHFRVVYVGKFGLCELAVVERKS